MYSRTAKDVKEVQAELVSDLATTMKSVREYEERISSGTQEIDRIQQEKTQIELLVRQAALKVFLEERLSNLNDELEQRLAADITLARMITEYFNAKEQVNAVDGQIKESSRAEKIYEITRRALDQPHDRVAYPLGVKGFSSPSLQMDWTPFYFRK